MNGTVAVPLPAIITARLGPVTWPIRTGRDLGLMLGVMLALGSAAAINLGFLLQHRGLHGQLADCADVLRIVRSALHSPTWLAGQLLGWIGFGVQIAAVALAPLTLVQAFAAGGLAVSVPLAAAIFHHNVSRRQTAAVVLTAASLASLPIALAAPREQLRPGQLLLVGAAATALGLALSRQKSAAALSIAAGIFYGIADSAIKAVSLGWGTAGPSALLSGWTLMAGAGTLAGFLAFQAGLRRGEAIGPISLMNAFATLTAILCGVLAFGESLGAHPVAVGGHALAVALLLACVPTLAGAQTQMTEQQTATQREPRRSAGLLVDISSAVGAQEQAAAEGK